jgi:hypothetical protein
MCTTYLLFEAHLFGSARQILDLVRTHDSIDKLGIISVRIFAHKLAIQRCELHSLLKLEPKVLCSDKCRKLPIEN